jgi:SAM-dependent methyltransferase
MIERFNERYATGNIPWNINRPDMNLKDAVMSRPIHSCKTLEIGCGTGDNAIWLASQGFKVTAIDGSQLAIQKAMQKAIQMGISCDFELRDFMSEANDESPFGFVFDRGCFHGFDNAEDRSTFAKKVFDNLEDEGLWLSLIGSTDCDREGTGPPRRSANDIVVATEPYFEILALYTSFFDSDQEEAARCWVCLMQKRDF